MSASEGTRARRVDLRSFGGSLTTLETDAWRGLLRAHASLMRDLDRRLIDAEGLSLSSYEVLLRLAQSPRKRMRMGDIADSLLVSRGGLTGTVNGLERRGFVVRERCGDDGRGIYAVMTKPGRTVFRRAQRVHLAAVRERFLTRLADEQLQQLADIWSAIGISTEPDLVPCDTVSDAVAAPLRKSPADQTRRVQPSSDVKSTFVPRV